MSNYCDKIDTLSTKRDTKWLIAKSKLSFGDNLDYSSTVYVDAKTKIRFRCKKHDFVFEQTSNNHFNSQHPCKFCLREIRRTTFADNLSTFKEKIRSSFGDQFDFENAIYINQRTPISLKCVKHNRVITKEPQVFLRGHGCDLCTREEFSTRLIKKTLTEIHCFVLQLNGKCHSKTYINNESKLDFECQFGHRFQRSWSEVKNSIRWCPTCSPNRLIGETLTRLMLEHLLRIKLPSCYIKEMNGLQLDGYNEKSKIAFEYQGYQHFTGQSHFHNGKHQFEDQLKRDQTKKILCKKNGITFIEIFEFKTIRAGRIKLFYDQTKEKLRELNLAFSDEPFHLDLIELYRGRKSELFEIAKEVVQKNNGKIQEYIGSENKHTYVCANGHKITNRTLGVIIKSNASCPYCESNQIFEKLKKIVESKGGVLIDHQLKPKGLSERYNWVCKKGHKCISIGHYLYNGHGCRTCQNEKQQIKLPDNDILQIKLDAQSGVYFQKELLSKYGISLTVYNRILSELNILPIYKVQDRKSQRKRTKGNLFQLDPTSLNVIKTFESLEAVKHDDSGEFRPEGIRTQMKKYKLAYGYYWCRENDYEETVRFIKNNNTLED